MELKTILDHRRSTRKFLPRRVEHDKLQRIVGMALQAPSSRNSRSTRLLVVEQPELLEKIASMRDYGSAFMKGAPLAIVVLGDTACSDLWRINAAISATVLHLACVDEGLASCWVHIDGRPRLKAEPQGESAADYLRTFLPIPEGCEPLCALAIGYSDFVPAPLPEADDSSRIIRL